MRLGVVISVLLSGMLVGCATQYDNQRLSRENRDLRRTQGQQRRAIQELRREQERLRGLVEELQYGGALSGGDGTPVPPDDRETKNKRRLAKRERSVWEMIRDGSGSQSGATRASEGPREDRPWVGGLRGDEIDGESGAIADGEQDRPGSREDGALFPEVGPPRYVSPDEGREPAPPFGQDEAEDGGGTAEVDSPFGSALSSPPAVLLEDQPRTFLGGSQQGPSDQGLELPPLPPGLRDTEYADGVAALTAGEYEGAIQAFRNFIHDNADSEYSDDAQFWIGEACFRQERYSRAIIEFNRVVVKFGSGDSSARALIRLAEAFSAIGDEVDAKLSLQKVVNRYPGSAEAGEASRLLLQMGG